MMKEFAVSVVLIVAALMATVSWPVIAWAVEVFVNGEEFSSMGDYRRKRAEAEIASERFEERSGPSGTAELQVPVAFDPAQGKTVVIAPDGGLKEEKGIAVLPDGTAYDPAQGRTIDISSAYSFEQVASREMEGDLALTEGGQPPDVIDRGRIAGVHPPLAQVVEQFQTAKGTPSAVRIATPYELEERLRKALQGTEGVVLLVAEPGKVSLYDLQGPAEIGNASDGQKTR